MIVILGLILLIAAIVIAVAAVVGNVGGAHQLTESFNVFGFHLTGSTGALFIFGIIVGAVGILGLSMLLGGLRRTSRRGHTARRGLKQSHRETAAARQDRDDLMDQRETPGAAGAQRNGSPLSDPYRVSTGDGHHHLRNPFRHRAAHR
ncbi:hypothetical protein J7F02_31595 [Streptomyces sp. ISL-112]|uniref:hypothetical protein n=1 Tax=unclassified Streptomyces TaxID=2593676 RepID=UPI001BE5A9BC|nr:MULTISPECIES: hypothetical protein [unclassified Streptomyces]MBT2430022.1 hypothetical protein [Streptomyces sp. ISL-112]MBT2461482.1 hypothetical protein [Streptomyces sp. ISL-63]